MEATCHELILLLKMLAACICNRFAKQCWLEKAGTAGVTAHEQPEEASSAVLVTRTWPQSTCEVEKYRVGSKRVFSTRIAIAGKNWCGYEFARITSWRPGELYRLYYNMNDKVNMHTACSSACLEGN
jgi:hypothetical protein